MSNLAKRIAELSPERRELLERLVKQEGVDISRAVILPRDRERNYFPLSFAQQRLWFLHQMNPDSPFYNIPEATSFNGRLNVAALERSFNEIARRHEALRTTFQTRDGQPVQVISPPATLRLNVVDLSGLPTLEREREAQQLANEEAQCPFDLASGPLLRAKLLRLADEEHVLLMTMHHIISDGWSMGVLTRELSTLYAAFCAGQLSPLAELPIQYADFAVWQREWLRGAVLEEQLAYWRKQLSGQLPLLELPADRPRPAMQSYRGASEGIEIDEQLTGRLRESSREAGATLFMTLLAAFCALLSRYTGQADILIGTPIAGRNRAEIENLIGFFVNTLVLRTQLNERMSFRELLRQVREVTLGAYAHQDLPFEKLVEELRPERSLSRMPLFQVVFSMDNTAAEQLTLEGTSTDFLLLETDTSKFDLRLAAAENQDTLDLSLSYSTDLFDAARMRRLLKHFQRLLEGIAADSSRRLSALPLLADEERRQVLSQWDESRREVAVHQCLHEMFAAQAEQTPDSIALVYENESLTYRELDGRANRLANYLRAEGVGPEVLVGLCVERSPNMIVGLLGILKAGGAYLPLEPEHPPERLSFMLSDARTQLILTEDNQREKFDSNTVKLVCLDTDWEAIARESLAAPVSGASPDNLAYVIYTSGSTGKPKGAMVTHANVARLFAATHEWFGFDERDVWTLFHSHAFDFSVWEMWGALLYGGRLVVVPYLVSRSPASFHALLVREKVTALNQTPSAFRQLMRADENGEEAGELSLRLVIFGGEALELQSLKPWVDRHGDARPQLVNMYGITETTVHVTSHPITAIDLSAGVGSRIGTPLPDLRVYVLDRDMNLAPFGVPGEMYVGGGGVARCYLNRAALTAERFVPDPFSAQPGTRLYKTGDLVRLLASGDIEYLGRIDQQVKIRGFRIELGEIEAALNEHDAVRESVVIAREDRPGDKRLVAYFVSAFEETAPHVGELRSFLRAKLPEHMIPAAFVLMEKLPLTVNGKIDRRALLAPGQERPALEQRYVAPRDKLEGQLAWMWQELLGIERIGVEDDFFGLGGDSIKGAVFINRLQEQLGEIVHVITVFQFPTIAQLAAYLGEQYAEAVRRMSIALASNDTGAPAIAEASRTNLPEAVSAAGARAKASQVNEEQAAQLRRLIKPLPPRSATESATALGKKNPPAIFVLSPPRSGSTLFRVMLAGHPRLFAPPELELLSFDTLTERRATFSDAQSFWLEGTIRAVMEIRQCDADEAKAVMHDLEQRRLTTKECYGLLQEWLGDRVLVDKTPSYALHVSILERAEADFENARYIHLLRHPHGMIRSFEEARLDQIFFRHEHAFTRRELAELIWLVSHENILKFLRRVPAGRQHRVQFEELLEQPEEILRGVCRFLGLEYAEAMQQPYRKKEQRMTDGIYAESRMLGDVKFHRYTGIEARVASRWRESARDVALANETWELAAKLGYEREPDEDEDSATATQMGLQPIPRLVEKNDTRLPLSFAQQRLWFIHQLIPDSAVYNIPLALRLSGRLNTSALEQSLGAIVERHSVLRTTFQTVDGEPVQVIAPPQPLSLPVLDVSGLTTDAREARAQELANEEAQQSFDLERDAALRLRLLRLDETEHVLLITMHHIISDGWSLGVFMHELSRLYAAFCAGRRSPLAALPIQYADFAAWQQGWLTGAVLEEQLAYWRRQLGGKLPILELPLDRPRPAMQTYHGAAELVELSEMTSRRLKELSREAGATLFVTLLTAFKMLLSRYTGQTDIIIGTPIAGRNRAELEELIGFFVNTLVLRTDLSDNPTFRDLLKRVRELFFSAYRHQDVPFEKLVDELQLPRDPSHTPLFQVMFTFRDASQEELKLEGLETAWTETDGEVAKFDLSLTMAEDDGRIGGAFVYNTDLFEAATIERLAGHFQTLLEGIVADPQRRLSELPLLTAAARRQLLQDFNQPQTEYPRHSSLQQLFEEQAERTPDAVALVCGSEQISYGELNARANRVGQYLRECGVKAEAVVGVLMERSIEMVSGILGVLKAGGAYLPLDPAYPQERLAFMLEDASASVILTQQPLVARLPEQQRPRVVCIDRDWKLIAQERVERPPCAFVPEQLAYIIYTSGSTGTPKGVAISHRNAVAFLSWAMAAFPKDVLAGVLASTSICFDLSVFELFAPLSCGGQIILAENALHLPALPAAQDVTLINTVPSAMAELIRMNAIPGSVRVVNLAGEALQNQLAQRLYQQATIERVFNLYGPSEDTTYSTFVAVEKGAQRQPTIGRPISNTQVYILDERSEPVPIGVAGELHLGGCGLARGYLKRPALTADRFIPNPFSVEAGARLYRTGDLARFLPNGEIEFLGRADHQVKLRGFRIESGEIEARLKQHEAVREAVVLIQADVAGDERLVAYVVAESGPEPLADVLRHYLREKLPQYMIPAAFVMLDALPLTPNGKLDRQALASLTQHGLEPAKVFVAPRDTLELQLAQIWEDLLNVRPIGITENFFELGGHSLLAVRMLARLRQQQGRDLPLATLMQAQTIEELASFLRQQPETLSESCLVAVQPRGAKPPLFCVHPAGGSIVGYSGLLRHLGSEQPFYGLQTPASQRLTSIEAMAARYILDLRAAQPSGPYMLGGWSMGGIVAFEMAQQLQQQGQQIALLAVLDSQAPQSSGAEDVDDESLLFQFFRDMRRLHGTEEWLMEEHGARASNIKSQLRSLFEQAQSAGAMPPDLSVRQLEELFGIFSRNVRAMLRYEPRLFPGRLTLFRASEQLNDSYPDPLKGWRGLAAEGVELHVVPGDHYTMMREPHVQVLAEWLRVCLEQSLALN